MPRFARAKVIFAVIGSLLVALVFNSVRQQIAINRLNRQVATLQDFMFEAGPEIAELQDDSAALRDAVNGIDNTPPQPFPCSEIGSTYTSKELRFSASCPFGWSVKEMRTEGKVTGVQLSGAGYRIIAERICGWEGSEGQVYKNPAYVIAGRKATVFEGDSGSGFFQAISLHDASPESWFCLRVIGETKNKTVTDHILSTLELLP